jgi:glycosyltransferase involved in cell wall biosynthesis
MTRIAIVTPILPVPFDIARGRFIHEQAKALSRIATIRIFLQTARYPAIGWLKPQSYVDGQVETGHDLWQGLDVDAYTYPALPWVSRPFNGTSGARRLLPRLRAFNPDVVVAYWAYPEGLSGVRAAHALGKPCIVGVLGSDVLTRSGWLARMTRTALHEADAVAVVSEHLGRVVAMRYGVDSKHVHTIINGYNTSVFHPRSQPACRSELGLPVDARLIVFVGRLIEAKGLRELLLAFDTLAASKPRIHLALVGDGVMRDELAALVHASPAAARIHMPGALAPAQVATWINAADVFTLPSWSEGYPNVVVESLACGRPVVASDVGGLPEIVTPDNGILVPARDPAALARGLASALARTWDHAGIAAGMQRTWDDVARETLVLCEAVRHTQHPSRAPG